MAQSVVLSFANLNDSLLVPNVQSAAETFQCPASRDSRWSRISPTARSSGEGLLMRRYAEELDKARRDLSGEG
ncbi:MULTISPECIES: hypothetical protein [unclassified Mesorhizobium]|uniref:hypothetical protein n=1 Tax=unclassified Mesorhizobium TaxID=325217 RepID=UPI00333A2035